MDSNAPEASAVACPLCEAAPGESCRSKGGAPVDFHVARVKAAETAVAAAAYKARKSAGAASPSPLPLPSVRRSTPPSGPERARLNRLAAGGWEVERCALLGIRLDVGSRANRWHVPRRVDDQVVSELAVAIVEAEAPPEALELAAARLADRGEP